MPSDWEKTIVIPIYKGGDRAAVTNYRPLRLTSVFCKQLEHVTSWYLRQVWGKNDWLYRDSIGLDRDTLVKLKSSQCART